MRGKCQASATLLVPVWVCATNFVGDTLSGTISPWHGLLPEMLLVLCSCHSGPWYCWRHCPRALWSGLESSHQHR